MTEHNHKITYRVYSSRGELHESDNKLIQQAIEAASRSYSPYSEFSVGAAVFLDNGSVIEGNNQENAAYPSGLCAERVALFYANSRYPNSPVKAIALVAQKNSALINDPVPPCGACRQALLEAETRFKHPIRIIMHGGNRTVVVDNARSLLPFSFKQDFLFNS